MKKNIQLFPSGIPIVDSAWGGFYHGGTYLLVGEKKSGKTLLSLQFAEECAKQNEICLFFTNSRPKDLMIHAASIDIDLEYYMNQNLIIVVRVANPPLADEYVNTDEALIEYLRDIVSVVGQYNPSRIVFDEITPYVEFEDLNLLRENFSETFEDIEDMGVTSLLILREPAAPASKMIFNILNAYTTGTIQLHKKSQEETSKSGVIDITPNVGHTEGRFKANYFIEPYRGITTDFKVVKKTLEKNTSAKPEEKYRSLADIDTPKTEILSPNLYTVEDFKLLMNNQIALFQITGQVFSVISLKITTLKQSEISTGLSILKNAIRLSADKKDKISTIGNKIFVLLTRENETGVRNFISRVKSNLPADDLNGKSEILDNISFYSIQVNKNHSNADDLLQEFNLAEINDYLDLSLN